MQLHQLLAFNCSAEYTYTLCVTEYFVRITLVGFVDYNYFSYLTLQTSYPSLLFYLTVNNPCYVFSHVRQTVYEFPYTLDQRVVCYMPNDVTSYIMIQCYHTYLATVWSIMIFSLNTFTVYPQYT